MNTQNSYASHWNRPPGRATKASRRDGGGAVHVVSYDRLESAIYTHDVSNPPPGWAYADGTWTFGAWSVVAEGKDGSLDPWERKWKLLRKGKRASKQSFRSADRARHYAELRLDRSSGPTRGPRPRGNGATTTLPDVRATKLERSAAIQLAEDTGFSSYAAFTRAALLFVSDLHENQRLSVEKGAFALKKHAGTLDR